ncbi:MAG: ATP-dependent DNA helicase RecG [Gammaproteobacteria bacterium]|nr:ATP-dependent DNA helicase RecG [Gammaproteobacteria bacterium]
MGQFKPPQLSASVTALTGVGTGLEKRLNRLAIYTVQDLLFHLPYRYLDRTRLLPIGMLQHGKEALIQGTVELTQIKFGKRRSLLCRISDGTGAVVLRFFYFNKSQQANLAKGTTIRCWGQARRGVNTFEMIHPEYQRISEAQRDQLEQTLTPVYPATEGLAQGRFRKLTDRALRILAENPQQLVELLPQKILAEYALPDLCQALQAVHRPDADTEISLLQAGTHPAQRRLAFEEFLAHQLSLRTIRRKIQSFQAPRPDSALPQADDFIRRLPFQLTGAQQTVLHEIQADLMKQQPMLRLIQGDVGSGKTVLAAIIAFQVIKAGLQVALMAPTELLAEQHFFTITQWFSNFDISVVLLTGRLNRAKRQTIVADIASSTPLMVVGTHALFQEQVKFSRLGIVIIDEQHRFGVHQRLSLLEKGVTRMTYPHQLIMTATPIPRTLAMTVFADLDISVIDELPPGRQAVKTAVLANDRRAEIIKNIARECRQGRQVYWVCTLIDESDAIQSQAATETYEYLSEMLPDLVIGLVHGRMKSPEKEQVMSAYKSGAIHLLVATTVIEVGVDVPAASLMVIENAERLGLAQLHQLRGRVGRGSQQSNCVLMYQPPLNELARQRLQIIRTTTDGFEIAKKDMQLRGPGEIMGTRQTGLPQMRIADLIRDAALIPHVRKAAELLLEDYPDRVAAIIKRWLTDRADFGNV